MIFNFSLAYAWKLPIEVSTVAENGEKVYNKLVIGIESDATDGFDNLWDAPAILSHPDPDKPLLLKAYFTSTLSLPVKGGGKKGGDAEDETKYLWKDIRGPTTKGDTIWEITVDPLPKGRTVMISWEVPQGSLNKGERLVLKYNSKVGADGKPVQVDMTQTPSYAFVSESEDPRSLSLVLSKEAVNNSKSDSRSGSGFGCGTIRPYKDGSPDEGVVVLDLFVLFIPLAFLRLLRLWRGLT